MAIQPDMIGIVVSEMASAMQFYRLLGLNIPEDAGNEPHVEVIAPNGYRIAWDTEELIRGLYPDWVKPVGQRLTLAFKLDDPSEVDALYQSIVDAGYQGYKEPWYAFWGQRYAVVADPDGTLIDLFAPLSA